jgi:hypothetical protein
MRKDGDMRQAAERERARRHAIWLMVLLALFVFRVLAQLLQWFFATAWLPSFEAWHSGTLPYPVLVGTQIAIIMVAIWLIRGLWRAAIEPRALLGRVLTWFGAVYFIGSVLRLLAGLTFGRDHAFLGAYLPGIFHVVLAVMVLTAANFHRNGEPLIPKHVRPAP